MFFTKKSIFVSLLLCLLVCGNTVSAQNEELLSQLDKILVNRQTYFVQKEKHISYLKKEFEHEPSSTEKMDILQKIIDEYKVFNVDSLMRYTVIKRDIAAEFDEPVYKQAANMNYAEALYLSGMYKESFDVLGRMTVERLDSTLLPYWYHLHHTIYGAMYENSVNDVFKDFYFSKAQSYGDSILSVSDPDSFVYNIVASDIAYKYGNCNKASYYLERIKNSDLSEHEKAILAYCKANVCRCKDNVDDEIKFLATASILEIPLAVREYSSLQQLALLLYEKGDVDRAYVYLSCALDDVILSHVKMRENEITKVFPIVEKAYRKQLDNSKKNRVIMLIVLFVIVGVLFCLLVVLYRQLKTIEKFKILTENSKNNLEKTLNELKSKNETILAMNEQLSEANKIKEKYLVQYMSLCSLYIENLDNLRLKVKRLTRNNSHLKNELGDIIDDKQIDEILEDFYINFDETFLGLFPSFISKFNGLLQPDNKIELPLEPNRMNTPLRIYALIRLGVTDSVQIAQFLRYSVSTIYNWRVKIRNVAVVDRENFDDFVQAIK